MNKNGFSLVELSIVLVVIGLLIGALVVGKEIVRNAELQALVAEFKEYEIAANNFKDKYAYWPGDFPDADEVWSQVNSNGHVGNGNGEIFVYSTFDERLYFWEHLMLADMIAGSYDGTGNSWPDKKDLGDMSRFEVMSQYIATSDARAYEHSGNALVLQAVTELGGADAYFIDKKLDDGYPEKGKLVVHDYDYDPTDCINDDPFDSYTATYIIGNSDSCSMIFYYYFDPAAVY